MNFSTKISIPPQIRGSAGIVSKKDASRHEISLNQSQRDITGFLKRVYMYRLPRHGVELRNSSLFVAIKSVNLRNLAALMLLGMVTSEIEYRSEFPDFNSTSAQNHTPAALVRQVQIDMATLGSHRGSFGSFAELFGPFPSSRLPRRGHLSPWIASLESVTGSVRAGLLKSPSGPCGLTQQGERPGEFFLIGSKGCS